ncbi:MAG: FCD domain-containing protein [Alphaproteobacteria bacterium]|nr:FCD domain-containing protein [Alphaproteobacteria bacterium]
MMPSKVRKLLRPADVVYDHVKRRIMMNEFKPEFVLTELGLAHEIGCSQGTIREALLRLQEDGLVTRTARRGTVVTRLNAEEAQEMLVLRRMIETRGAAKAARKIDKTQLAEIAALRERMDEAAAQGDEYALMQADTEFHLAIFRASGLDALEQILARCIKHSHRWKIWAPSHKRALEKTAARHDVLFERLAAGDGEGLAAALGKHIDTIVRIGSVPKAVR